MTLSVGRLPNTAKATATYNSMTSRMAATMALGRVRAGSGMSSAVLVMTRKPS